MPVTEEVQELIESCDLNLDEPFARQLWSSGHNNGRSVSDTKNLAQTMRRQYMKMEKKLGITKRIILHDLRRTSAVGMLEASGDIRDVQALLGHHSLQSTVLYLDHDLRPINRDVLELIKRPEWRKDKIA